MTPFARRLSTWIAALTAALALCGCGYNHFQTLDEQVKAGWSDVLNQYQRRADLIPNIVATVKGEANFEQETLTKVIDARAKATSIQVTPETLRCGRWRPRPPDPKTWLPTCRNSGSYRRPCRNCLSNSACCSGCAMR